MATLGCGCIAGLIAFGAGSCIVLGVVAGLVACLWKRGGNDDL